jgi:hypothetical protein
MKPRSPVLGYNHNVRYAGRLWHVQTEDSGVNNPHIFTHLFHDGTILATKRLDYDPESAVAAVQKQMQTQHKAMLRDLKAGQFDDKIAKFFGEPVNRAADDETTDPNAQPPVEEIAPEGSAPHVDSLPAAPRASQPTGVAMPPRPRSVTPPPTASKGVPVVPAAAARAPSSANVPRTTGGIGSRRAAAAAAPTGNRPTAEGVVVSRPAVIIGGEGTNPRAQIPPEKRPTTGQVPRTDATPTVQTTTAERTPTADNIFGGDLISEKSLDEVILAYLSEDLNEK